MATVLNNPVALQAPPAAVTRILSRFDRDQLAAFISVAIDLLDIADGDPDLENATNLEDDFILTKQAKFDAGPGPGCRISDAGEHAGDEEDGTLAEDEPCAKFLMMDKGPGCTVSDPDAGVEDEGHDPENEY
ncbi:hypothetical protein KFK14_19650 [Sphingobium phenoxybenzoativorans]|uniref:Uncharacterized protein n=1 Tax=Sphingobium phenoxybenzoativorans TaxID=1592790 RepID=A0A975Q1A6_9SPHN|nr:hypothetical protein [Sphingobium phenoxybenzoativorans]QUT05187.1 hypothetical protein KFK14_19650 [Sphingobium phenoxybenzoativorans]